MKARPTGRLLAELRPRATLKDHEVAAMWAVFRRYYDDVNEARFRDDLAGKHYVFLLKDSGDGSVQGFSTVQLYDQRIAGRRARAVYSGDTIVERAYWGQNALQRAFFFFLVREKLRRPHLPLYWFLISKGYKTYLLVARNFPHHYPRHDAAKDPARAERYRAVVEALAEKKFGAALHRASGTLRFDQCLGRLRNAVAPITEQELKDPAIRFFAEKNPGHEAGDELCCLAEVDLALVGFYTQKLVARTMRELTAKRPVPGLPRRVEE
jgi:hypothetical protein